MVKVQPKEHPETPERDLGVAAAELELYQRDNDTPSRPSANLPQLANAGPLGVINYQSNNWGSLVAIVRELALEIERHFIAT